MKGVKQPFYVKRVNYNYQEIKNLRGCQDKSYWALKVGNAANKISKLIKRYLNFVNKKQWGKITDNPKSPNIF